MTKTEYAKYRESDHWRELRKGFIACSEHNHCERCFIPRWLAAIAYDQDLHVHHKSYANLGNELEVEDLESLCRRCHEVETFGRSDLRTPRSATCESCQVKHWDPYSRLCAPCALLNGVDSPDGETLLDLLDQPQWSSPGKGLPLWKGVVRSICNLLACGDSGVDQVMGELAEIDGDYIAWEKQVNTGDGPVGRILRGEALSG